MFYCKLKLGGLNLKILYGTANPAKILHLKEVLDGLDIEIIGLNDVGVFIDPIDESGNNPLENAKIKALAYYKAVKMPVFSTDSGLYIEDLDDEDQPGVHVRRINGKVLNDEEMIEHYSQLASKLGGEAIAKYRNAICLILDEESIFEYDGDDIASPSFLIVSKAYTKRNIGFPLNSLSKDIETGEYSMDMDSSRKRKNSDRMTKGFRNFFLNAIYKGKG